MTPHEQRLQKQLPKHEVLLPKKTVVSRYLSYFRAIRREVAGKVVEDSHSATHLCELCLARLRLTGSAATSNAKSHLRHHHST